MHSEKIRNIFSLIMFEKKLTKIATGKGVANWAVFILHFYIFYTTKLRKV